MAQRIIPFENDSDKQFWMNNNCNICKRQDCYVRRCLKGEYLENEITVKQAGWVGIENGELRLKCSKFNRPNQRSKYTVLESEKFLLNMF